MEAHSFQVISALALTLSGVVSGALAFLLKRNEKLEGIIDGHNETLRKNNEALMTANASLKSAIEALTALQREKE